MLHLRGVWALYDNQSVLLPTNITDSDDIGDDAGGAILPESISIGRIDELLAQMRFHEVPKRAAFSIPLQLAPEFTIGVKGSVAVSPPMSNIFRLAEFPCMDTSRYGLITEQKKGAYRYFAETDAGMEVVESRTSYVDEVRVRTRCSAKR